MRFIGAFDPTVGGSHDQYPWVPNLGSDRGEGAWALFGDSTGCLWAGGDFDRGGAGASNFVEGFARFCPADTAAPGAPDGLAATTSVGGSVSLSWNASSDDRDGPVRYQILRNDRIVAAFIRSTSIIDRGGVTGDRYFVRAVDADGNFSATTPVVVAPGPVDTVRPTGPRDLVGELDGGDVLLSWSASSDDVGVAGYRVFRNGVEFDSVSSPSVTVVSPAVGSHWYQVQAFDAAGNESWRTPPLRIDIA